MKGIKQLRQWGVVTLSIAMLAASLPVMAEEAVETVPAKEYVQEESQAPIEDSTSYESDAQEPSVSDQTVSDQAVSDQEVSDQGISSDSDSRNAVELLEESLTEDSSQAEENNTEYDLMDVANTDGTCASGINGNGTSGIYIDINSAPYTTFAGYSNGQNAYGPSGCAWFASARVHQLTGKGSTIWSGKTWWNSGYASLGFSRGTTVRAKALACFENHVSVVEAVNGNTVTISQGGSTYYSDAAHGYCEIRTMTVDELQSSSGAGAFYGYVYLDGAVADNAPVGNVDEVSSNSEGTIYVRGWAYDPDTSASIAIHVYVGGEAGSGAPGYAITADESSDDVNNVYGINGYHRFADTIAVSASGTVPVYFYAINNTYGGANTWIGTINVTIKSDTTAPVITDAQVSNVTCQGYTVTCKATDNVGIDRVQFPTWTLNNDQDDIDTSWNTSESSRGTSDGDTYTFQVNRSSHNNEYGYYATHIYAYDAAGNSTTLVLPDTYLDPVECHTYDEGVITKEPTTTATGIRTYTCTRCGETRTEEITVQTVTVVSGKSYTAQITAAGEKVYYEYTPSSSNTYVLCGKTGTADVTLYDSDGNIMDSGSGEGFRAAGTMTAGKTYRFEITAAAAGDVTFTFGRVYTIKYNANGGSGAPAKQTKDYGSALTLSTTVPTRTGYTFLGWSADKTATAATYKAGGSYTANGNTTLYAVWQQNTATLSSGRTCTAQITAGGSKAYYEFTPTSSNTYVIYSTGSADTRVALYDASGTLLATNDNSGEDNNFRLAYAMTAGTTYRYAVYYRSSSATGSISFTFGRVYTIKYNANGGSGAPAAQTKDYGKAMTISGTVPTRSGYTFLGWSAASTATSPAYTAGASYTANGNTTLYAVWQQNTATLSSGRTCTAQITAGCSKAYYDFTPTASNTYVIYSTGSADTRVALYDASGTLLATNDNSGEGNNFRLAYAMTAGTTYRYAVYYRSSSATGSILFTLGRVYTIRYNANGGSGAPAAQTHDYGTTLTLSSTVPTRSGYTFLGWAANSTATTATYKAGGSYTANGNVTLYAVWKAK